MINFWVFDGVFCEILWAFTFLSGPANSRGQDKVNKYLNDKNWGEISKIQEKFGEVEKDCKDTNCRIIE